MNFRSGDRAREMIQGSPPPAGARVRRGAWARLRLALVLVPLIFSGVPWAAADSEGWETLADGIEYREFVLPGPNRAYVARMDLHAPNVTLETAIPQPGLDRPVELLSQMAARYEQTLAAWPGTWGPRNDVVVAINGSYFDRDTGFPQGIHVHSGWFSRWEADGLGGRGFFWTRERVPAVALCLDFEPADQRITFPATGASIPLFGIDVPHGYDTVVAYTPVFETQSYAHPGSAEVVVELARPLWAIPHPRMLIGMVREVRDGQGPAPIPFNRLVLSGLGAARDALLAHARPGEPVGIAIEAQNYTSDCRDRQSLDLTGTYAGLSAGYAILRDGEIFVQDDPNAVAPHPRTAIAFNDAFLYFVVVDGRNPQWSVGMTHDELARFCRDTLGATWAVNQDGGGSSSIWVNGEIRNRPSDGGERAVANGMMMVALEPASRSTAFVPRERVRIGRTLSPRLGPGSNYAPLPDVEGGTYATIGSVPGELNGLLATGAYWWEINLASGSGWVPEDALTVTGKSAWGDSILLARP